MLRDSYWVTEEYVQNTPMKQTKTTYRHMKGNATIYVIRRGEPEPVSAEKILK